MVRWEKINPGQDYNEWETQAQAQKDLEARSDRTVSNGDQVHGVFPGNGTGGQAYADRPAPLSANNSPADSGIAQRGYPVESGQV